MWTFARYQAAPIPQNQYWECQRPTESLTLVSLVQDVFVFASVTFILAHLSAESWILCRLAVVSGNVVMVYVHGSKY